MLSDKQQNHSERSCGMRYDAIGRNSEYIFIGQNDPVMIDIEIIILARLPQHNAGFELSIRLEPDWLSALGGAEELN